GEGSGTPTEPHDTPFPEVTSSHPTTSSTPLPSIPTAPIPTVTQTALTPIIQYLRRARIAQSSALPTVADDHASPVRDDSQGEACPTDFGFIADQDRATIAKLKDRVKLLEDKKRVIGDKSRDDAPIKRRITNEGEAAAERISNDSEKISRVLTSMDAATVLAGETNVPTGINLEKEQVKKQKSSEEAPETETSTEEFTEDKIKEIMQLVLVEDVYVQALQV
nr:hypothetical protein [Tanacetum cinerariifolium]